MSLINFKKNNPWIIFLVTGFGASMSALDGGIVNVALPTINEHFHSILANSQWLVSIYLLSLCTCLPIAGRLNELFTRRKIYLSGFVFFTMSSMCCGMAWSLTSLTIFRMIQGIGAAMIMSGTAAIILSFVPKEKHGRALGINSMTVAFGSIAGPSLGGFLVQWLGWRSIFYVNLPIGLLAYYFGYHILPRNEVPVKQKLDLLGAALLMISIITILLILNNDLHWGWLSLNTFFLFMFSVIIFFLFIFREKKITYPLLNLNLFKIKKYVYGNLVSFFTFSGIAVNSILLPFCLSDQLKFMPATIGLFLFIPPIFIVFIAPLSGYLADLFDHTILVLIGLSSVITGLFLQTFLQVDSSVFIIIASQSCVGFGFSFMQSPNNYRMLRSVPKESLSSAASFNSLMRNLGKIFGVVASTTAFSAIRNHLLKITPEATSHAFFVAYKYSYFFAVIFVIFSILITAKEFKQRKLEAREFSVEAA